MALLDLLNEYGVFPINSSSVANFEFLTRNRCPFDPIKCGAKEFRSNLGEFHSICLIDEADRELRWNGYFWYVNIPVKPNQVWRTKEGRLVYTIVGPDGSTTMMLWFDQFDKTWNAGEIHSRFAGLIKDPCDLPSYVSLVSVCGTLTDFA